MENTASAAYSHGQSNSQSTASTGHTRPSSLHRPAAIKLLPAPLQAPPPYSLGALYQDAVTIRAQAVIAAECENGLPGYCGQSRREATFQPYSDAWRPSSPDGDDVPLGQLIITHMYAEPEDDSYGGEAPPPYAIAVRQSFRETLIQHIPHSQHEAGEVDEESEVGIEIARPDDVRYSVERMVAMVVVAIILFVISGILAWLALGRRMLG
ncbi:hypothetical protein ACJQWK_06854 [Exserohilum turcicum]|uniref:Uncharacterized protein n=1 Tax=Exserohilum turcicum (strain 28A) TaxID=671987 RepID=R0IK35_EXST2|nr:uncharacterized protein SETTUDRAFT_42340 [Exserohilum turcica Et28A]EOA85221.1 hypothetical protein SETTUDRAFT_42340 [Exserohilum turcica Et28A]